jgi:hypothetical protein
MAIQHPIHLVGSVPLADAETVFREVGAHLGTVAKRYPGETGVRLGWLRWQRPSFDNNPAFEIDPAATNVDKSARETATVPDWVAAARARA